jgi:hypothetical protein
VSINPSITISADDPVQIAARAREEIERGVREALRGVYGDT